MRLKMNGTMMNVFTKILKFIGIENYEVYISMDRPYYMIEFF